jgi:cyclopropane fatty-acyl-phospholipid synthase-like methyltransferase
MCAQRLLRRGADVQCRKEFIPGYFGVIDSVLNEKGLACVQVITIPESRFEKCQSAFLSTGKSG